MPADATTHPARAGTGAALGALTGAKFASNAAFRWVPLFLPTLERAFGTTTATMTTVLGAGELAGLATVLVGGPLDRGHERRVFLAGLLTCAVSCALTLVGTLAAFAASYVLLVLGVATLTVAGHAWIAARTDFSARARSIGIFETSWATGLLIGAPVAGLLISVWGWRAPLVAWIVACVTAAVIVTRVVPADRPRPRTTARPGERSLPPSAWRIIVGSAATAGAGLTVLVVSGVWLEDRFGLSAAGVGTVALAFGAVELAASLTTVRLTDRLGKPRAVAIGLGLVGVALTLMLAAGDRTWMGVIALTVFLGGFEFAFVSSLALVSEAAPEARGKAVGTGNAVATIARAGAAVAAGALYEAAGITGPVALAGACALAAFALLAGRTGQRARYEPAGGGGGTTGAGRSISLGNNARDIASS